MMESLNLLLGWLWMLLGFLSGMLLGMFFHREGWLGGYGSLRRRMYRLGHISFFGLGAANLAFHFTARELSHEGPLVTTAAWAFVIGAATMPACCVLMAHFPRARVLFSVPVLSLIIGAFVMLVSTAKHRSAGDLTPGRARFSETRREGPGLTETNLYRELL